MTFQWIIGLATGIAIGFAFGRHVFPYRHKQEGRAMRWHWQKQIKIGRGYVMFTIGQGFGFGFIYHTCNGSLWLGPVVIDFTIPTPLWWQIVRNEAKN